MGYEGKAEGCTLDSCPSLPLFLQFPDETLRSGELLNMIVAVIDSAQVNTELPSPEAWGGGALLHPPACRGRPAHRPPPPGSHCEPSAPGAGRERGAPGRQAGCRPVPPGVPLILHAPGHSCSSGKLRGLFSALCWSSPWLRTKMLSPLLVDLSCTRPSEAVAWLVGSHKLGSHFCSSPPRSPPTCAFSSLHL